MNTVGSTFLRYIYINLHLSRYRGTMEWFDGLVIKYNLITLKNIKNHYLNLRLYQLRSLLKSKLLIQNKNRNSM